MHFITLKKIYRSMGGVKGSFQTHIVNISVVFAFNTTQFIELTVENDCMKNAIS